MVPKNGIEEKQDDRTKIESPWAVSFKRLKKNRMALVSLIILSLLAIMAFVAPFITPFGYNEGNMRAGSMPWKLDIFQMDNLSLEGPLAAAKAVTVRPNDHTIHYVDENGRFLFEEVKVSQIDMSDNAETKRSYISLHDEKEPNFTTIKTESGKALMFSNDDFSLVEVKQVTGNFFDFVTDHKPLEYDADKKTAVYNVDGDIIEVNWMIAISPKFVINGEKYKFDKDAKTFNTLAGRKKTFAVYHVGGKELFVDWKNENTTGEITINSDGRLLPQKRQINKSYLMGTDKIGRCIYTRLVYGGRISLSVGIVATSLQVFLGLLFGSVSGYYGGVVDTIIMRLTEVVMSFPFLLICITMSVVLGPSIYTVMLIIGVLGWTGIARMIRAQILSLREQEFMEAATALGIKDSGKIVRHLWPNVMALIIVYATLGMSGAILTEAALSFLGLGVQPPKASWGNMLSNLTQKQIESMPWLWIPAGASIFVTVMSFNILGDGLRDALDPKLKR